MIPTIIVGIVFGSILLWAVKKSHKDIKNNTCAGCSGSCSPKEKSACHK